MDNLVLYNALRTPPKEALKLIEKGRMKGMSDINPMWRIKAMTEQFGPCGMGWKYEITRQWTEPGAAGEISAFCNIMLYYQLDGQWSEGIPGTGGSSLVANERNGPHTNDECYKMALTDAISVACKALGVAGDVYWQNDPTKYGQASHEPNTPSQAPATSPSGPVCERCGKRIVPVRGKDGRTRSSQQISEYSLQHYGRIYCLECQKKEREHDRAAG